MYVRFVSTLPDLDTGRPIGVFHASLRIRRNPETPDYVVRLLEEHRDWFNDHMHAPKRLTKSKYPHAMPVALCWFQATATEHIARAHEVAALISDFTFAISMITSKRPGIIIYRDPYQVAAVPFRNT